MPNFKNRIKLKAEMENFESFMAFLETSLNDSGVPVKTIASMMTATEEMIVNVINYAYPESRGDLDIQFNSDEKKIEICIKDWGQKFNPLEKADPDTTLDIEEREAGGLGIFLVKKLSDETIYDYRDNSNVFTIIKYK